MPEEWTSCLDAWIALAEAHLGLSVSQFQSITSKDRSVSAFLLSYVGQAAKSPDAILQGDLIKCKRLRKDCFFLSSRLLEVTSTNAVLSWVFLSDFAKVYGKTHASRVISMAWSRSRQMIESSLASLKSSLIAQLNQGLKGDPSALEAQLKRLNQLLHVSTEADEFFMTGTDFLDGLVSCYKLMNPPLRKAIISTTYLCILGLTDGSSPNFALLTDQLYSLKAAAEAHKVGPTNVNDSLVAELVTVTPILRQLQLKIGSDIPGSGRAKAVITALEGFKKANGARPKKLVKRKINKGKGVVRDDDYGHGTGQVHVHRVSLITQVQDLFPDLGAGFVMKLLDEYNENVEEVISHLLEGSLPSHLEGADRAEPLYVPFTFESCYANCSRPASESVHITHQDLAPRSTPPLLPTRRNVFDDDEFDRLAVSADRLHIGRRHADKTADAVLADKSDAPGKAAILSALAAFDSDDDERDDTYDVEDVGGTVDSAAPGGQSSEDIKKEEQEAHVHEEALYRAYKMMPELFDRDTATRRSQPRTSLKQETGMTDEAIEGWALMLSRDPRRLRRLEARYDTFAGNQSQLASTSWQAGSGTEDSDSGRGGYRGRGRGRGRGAGGRGRGNVAGPTGDKDTEAARRHKDANKSSRANHNRRDQRARKMARGGFPG